MSREGIPDTPRPKIELVVDNSSSIEPKSEHSARDPQEVRIDDTEEYIRSAAIIVDAASRAEALMRFIGAAHAEAPDSFEERRAQEMVEELSFSELATRVAQSSPAEWEEKPTYFASLATEFLLRESAARTKLETGFEANSEEEEGD